MLVNVVLLEKIVFWEGSAWDDLKQMYYNASKRLKRVRNA